MTDVKPILAEVWNERCDVVRLAALKALGAAITQFGDDAFRNESLLLCHRILANDDPDGRFRGETANSQNEQS